MDLSKREENLKFIIESTDAGLTFYGFEMTRKLAEIFLEQEKEIKDIKKEIGTLKDDLYQAEDKLKTLRKDYDYHL